MLLRPLRNTALVLSTVSLLTACGGGGGGGGSEDNSSDAPASSSSLSMDTGGYSTRKAAMNSQQDFEAFSAVYDSYSEAFNLVYEVEVAISGNGLKPVVYELNDSSRLGEDVTDLACENEGGLVRITDESVANIEATLYEFTQCELTTATYGTLLLNGTYRFKVTESTRDGADTLEASETYNVSGKYLPSGKALAIKGDSDFRESINTDTGTGDVYLTVGTLEFKSGEDYVAVKNLRSIVQIRENEVFLSDRLTLIGSAINGFVEYTTPTSLVVPRYVENACPLQGVSRMSGDGIVEIRYGMSTGTGHAVVVEVNNNTVAASDSCQPPETEL